MTLSLERSPKLRRAVPAFAGNAEQSCTNFSGEIVPLQSRYSCTGEAFPCCRAVSCNTCSDFVVCLGFQLPGYLSIRVATLTRPALIVIGQTRAYSRNSTLDLCLELALSTYSRVGLSYHLQYSIYDCIGSLPRPPERLPS